MRYQESKPRPQIRDWVKCYWFLEKDYTPLSPVESVLPDGCIDLVVHFGADFQVDPGASTTNTPRTPTGFLIGPLNRQLTLYASGRAISYGIRFYPYGVYPFLSSLVRELIGQLVDIVDVFGAAGAELIARLAASTPERANGILDWFLLGQLHSKLADAELIRAASQYLYDQRGATTIAHLATYLNLSERSLERKFLLTTGFTPKMLARVVRFNHIKNELILKPQQNLTDLATRYLYFDQAHFIHDFPQFTGLSPLNFVRRVNSGLFRFNK